MKRFVRTAGIAVTGAIGLALWASAAQAQMSDPSQPVQPKAISPTDQPAMFIPTSSASTSAPAPNPQPQAPSEAPQPAAPQPEPALDLAAGPDAATETGVRQADGRPIAASARSPEIKTTTRAEPPTATPAPERPVVTAPGPGERVKSFLSGLASACKVGVAFPTGGPVLAFAVLAAAIALEGARFHRIRSLWDEDAPELLYAGDVIAPG